MFGLKKIAIARETIRRSFHFSMNLIMDHNLQEIESLRKPLPKSEEQSKLLQDCDNADTIICILDDVSGALNHTKLYIRCFFSSLVILIKLEESFRDTVHKFYFELHFEASYLLRS